MSSPYLYHPKVLHPDKMLYQMTSNEYQTPFYFGGSQVPEITNYDGHSASSSGSGLHRTYLRGIKKSTIPIFTHMGAGIGASKIIPDGSPKYVDNKFSHRRKIPIEPPSFNSERSRHDNSNIVPTVPTIPNYVNNKFSHRREIPRYPPNLH